ncbi:MAG TPA: hypothetical protein VIR16_08105, partial [Candidatus Limnocylindrales bacterium]
MQTEAHHGDRDCRAAGPLPVALMLGHQGLDRRAAVRFNGHMHNQMVINQSPADQLSVVFGALADPTRRAILERLVVGE